MGNKITPPNVVTLPTPLNKTPARPEQQENNNKTIIDINSHNKDTLSLSEEGKRMSKQFSEGSHDSLHLNRVAEVKRAVKNGTIKINDDSIAERLLQIEGELSITDKKK